MQNSDTRLQNSYPWILIGVLSHFIGRHIRTLKRNMVQGHTGNDATTWNRDLCVSSKRATSHNARISAGKKLPKALPCCPISQSDNLTWPLGHLELFLQTFFFGADI